jgi:hypothetical protein
VITSDELNDDWRRDDGVQKTASSFLSSNTVLRVVTEAGHIYADGRFYSPARLRGTHRFTDLELFVAVPELGKITKKEKGELGRGSWQKGSIFYVIDKIDNVFTSDTIEPDVLVCTSDTIEPDVLVCDDLGNEIADFVAIETGKSQRIALLHAKNGSGAGSLSVGSLHEVVSQAKRICRITWRGSGMESGRPKIGL